PSLVPVVWPRAAPPPAIAGGGTEILSAGRIFVGAISVRHRAVVRLRWHTDIDGDRRGYRPTRSDVASGDGSGVAGGLVFVQGRRRAVSLVGARCVPRCPHARHGVHGGGDENRGVRRDAADLLCRATTPDLGLAASAMGYRRGDHARGRGVDG